jgi:hypothetical protein
VGHFASAQEEDRAATGKASGTAPEEDQEMMLAAFVILVCGLAALAYFISVRRGMSPERPEQERDGEQERDKNQGLLRDERPPW